MVLVGTTLIFFWVKDCTWLAVRIMFLLLGKMMTLSEGVVSTAWRISLVLGFIVWPPGTTAAAPRLPKTSISPSPEATAITAVSVVGILSFCISRKSWCCSSMLRMLTWCSVPSLVASWIILPGVEGMNMDTDRDSSPTTISDSPFFSSRLPDGFRLQLLAF